MTCQNCGEKTTVIDTRSEDRNHTTYRKHRCKNCKYTFYTAEIKIPETRQFQNIWKALARK